MMMYVVIAAFLAATASTAPIELAPFGGVMISAQYRCDDFLCPDWELDVSRIDPSFRPINLTQKLAMLIPKSPAAAMSFPVFSAYHTESRTFYTVGLPDAQDGTVWAHTVNGAVNDAVPVANTDFTLDSGTIVRTVVSSNNTLFALFEDGSVRGFDSKTATWVIGGNVLTGAQKLYQGSVVDQATDNFYVFVKNGAFAAPSLVTFNLRTQHIVTTVTVSPIKPAPHWELENIFQAVFISNTTTGDKVVFFMTGTFDSLVEIDPTTGDAAFLFYDITSNPDCNTPLIFDCPTDNTKTCDMLQCTTYDAVENRIYFQATDVSSDEKVTVIAYVDYVGKKGRPFIEIGLEPWTFGYMGYHWATVQP